MVITAVFETVLCVCIYRFPCIQEDNLEIIGEMTCYGLNELFSVFTLSCWGWVIELSQLGGFGASHLFYNIVKLL